MRQCAGGSVYLQRVGFPITGDYESIWTEFFQSPPGGKYTAPPPIYAPTASTAYYSTGACLSSVKFNVSEAHCYLGMHAQPTSTGTIADCGRYHDVASGDTCNSVALR